MEYLLLMVVGVVVLIYHWIQQRRGAKHKYLGDVVKARRVSSMTATADQAVDIRALTEKSRWQKLRDRIDNVGKQLGSMALIKVIVAIVLLAIAGNFINQSFLRLSPLLAILVTEILGLGYGLLWLQKREEKHFEETFPDALNMLASAVSAGESIMHAIGYVGTHLEGDVGKEFNVMYERLRIGETPDEVFRKACDRFPYPSFQFFVITLRANISRGGQLKDVINRINRVMFDARAMEKKKIALTSEARMSAKIVGSIPFIFLIFMQYMSPENYEYVMFNEAGRPILYYMLISEFIGMAIIWKLMRGAT
ncbi:type II secretion system F family protein [Vibrio ulleungensis]|uniref:Type II secretion system F family protein n=1 Tax=Vibrio ulleungensis TaxID=2807619 RepID=A0ABS2HR72_9VIBR|nr:type II secretion system F family protein [Vibrio ulleungensis]MBM7038386.1 type II secretion system F family protein [Vibrio ulleungensis]